MQYENVECKQQVVKSGSESWGQSDGSRPEQLLASLLWLGLADSVFCSLSCSVSMRAWEVVLFFMISSYSASSTPTPPPGGHAVYQWQTLLFFPPMGLFMPLMFFVLTSAHQTFLALCREVILSTSWSHKRVLCHIFWDCRDYRNRKGFHRFERIGKVMQQNRNQCRALSDLSTL